MKPLNRETVFSTLSAVGLIFFSTSAVAANGYFDCPISPTQFQVSIPDPDPGSGVGEFPTDLDEMLAYVLNNNIGSVKELLDHAPDHMRKNYAFVANTRALGQTSVDEPGLVLFGSDGRFMLNMDTSPTSPRYEFVDIAYLNDEGDWEFKALDFSNGLPTLSPNGGRNGECRECHGQDGALGNGPMRPIWGNYLDWPGLFSDNGQNEEKVTAEQAATLTRIQNGTQNPQRFHAIIKPSRFFDIGSFIRIPDHQYGISLTVSNNEIGSAAAESIFKRIKRSALYDELSDEFLVLSHCVRAGQTTSADKTSLIDLINSLGGSSEGISNNFSAGWMDIMRLWGLDPLHEFPLDKLTNEYATNTVSDTNWNASSGSLLEQLNILVLLDQANKDQRVDSILLNNQTSYEMTACGILFDNQKEYLQHKKYANFTLKGSARQRARSSYYDIDYTRVSQSMANVEGPLCRLLVSGIGEGTSTTPTPTPTPTQTQTPTPTPTPPGNASSPIADTCSRGQVPVSDRELTAGTAICLPAIAARQQIQMHLYVPDDMAGKPLQISLAHGTGNGDLLHKAGSRPNLLNFDTISNNSETAETIVVQAVQQGWNYIHTRTETGLSGATLFLRYLQ